MSYRESATGDMGYKDLQKENQALKQKLSLLTLGLLSWMGTCPFCGTAVAFRIERAVNGLSLFGRKLVTPHLKVTCDKCRGEWRESPHLLDLTK